MRKVELSSWYIEENTLSINISNFMVSIVPMNYHIELLVFNEGIFDSKYKFYSFEEAVAFTEEVISKATSIDEIQNQYTVLNPKPKLKSKKL